MRHATLFTPVTNIITLPIGSRYGPTVCAERSTLLKRRLELGARRAVGLGLVVLAQADEAAARTYSEG